MRRLTIAEDVAARLGKEKTEAIIKGPSPAEYSCIVCHVRGMFHDGAEVVARLDVYTGGSRPTMRLRFVHKECGPGGVYVVNDATVVPRQKEVVGICGAIEFLGQLNPFVIVEQLFTAIGQLPSGEFIDEGLAEFASQGMQPVAGLTAIPAQVDGWRVVIPPRGRPRGGVFGPQGLVLLEPMCPVPQGWVTMVTRRGSRCSVFAGSEVGLNYLARQPADTFIAAIESVAKAGRLMGVTAVMARQ